MFVDGFWDDDVVEGLGKTETDPRPGRLLLLAAVGCLSRWMIQIEAFCYPLLLCVLSSSSWLIFYLPSAESRHIPHFQGTTAAALE